MCSPSATSFCSLECGPGLREEDVKSKRAGERKEKETRGEAGRGKRHGVSCVKWINVSRSSVVRLSRALPPKMPCVNRVAGALGQPFPERRNEITDLYNAVCARERHRENTTEPAWKWTISEAYTGQASKRHYSHGQNKTYRGRFGHLFIIPHTRRGLFLTPLYLQHTSRMKEVQRRIFINMGQNNKPLVASLT